MDETRGRESPSPGIPLEGSRIFADLVLLLNELLQDTRTADLSTPLRFGRDDKGRAVFPLGIYLWDGGSAVLLSQLLQSTRLVTDGSGP